MHAGLSCVPQVLIKAIRLSLDEPLDVRALGYWIEQDAALTYHLLWHCQQVAVLHEALPIDQQLQQLSPDELRNLLFHLAIQQIGSAAGQLPTAFLHGLWKSALTRAKLARSLAILSDNRFASPVYQAALLQTIGQLELWDRYRDAYLQLLNNAGDFAARSQAERELAGEDYVQISVNLLADAGWSEARREAALYHQEALASVRDAQQLVKLVNIATRLAEVSEAGAANADLHPALFTEIEAQTGFKAELLRELIHQVASEVSHLEAELGLADSPATADQQHTLMRLLADFAARQAARSELLTAQSEQQLYPLLERVLKQLLGVSAGLLFMRNDDGDALLSVATADARERFSIVLAAGRSRVADAALQNTVAHIGQQDTASPLAVVDRQLLRFLSSGMLSCLPLRQADDVIGVLVIPDDAVPPVGDQNMDSRLASISTVCADLLRIRERLRVAAEQQQFNYDQLQLKIRETLHEANNPLAIVNNYLHTISLRLGQDETIQKDIERITGELRRAQTILGGLSRQEDSAAPDASLSDIRAVVQKTVSFIENGLLAGKDISISVDIDASLGGHYVQQTAVQQIIMNLLKNAAEAMPDGGTIRISAFLLLRDDRRMFLGLDIADNGPGLPAEVQNRLFMGVQSSKAGHAGLGLRIVKGLVEGMGGSIYCRSGSEGTTFQMQLPLEQRAEL